MSASTRNRVDITRKVTGRMGDGKMVLYYNKRRIGKIDLADKRMEVVDGYEVDQHRIYMTVDIEAKDRYAESCDMGWC